MIGDDLAVPPEGALLLRRARELSGLSQAELAERAGVPRTMVSAYERDLRQPSLPTLRRLLSAAGFELRTLLASRDEHVEVPRAWEEQFTAADQASHDAEAEQRRAMAHRRAAQQERQERPAGRRGPRDR